MQCYFQCPCMGFSVKAVFPLENGILIEKYNLINHEELLQTLGWAFGVAIE